MDYLGLVIQIVVQVVTLVVIIYAFSSFFLPPLNPIRLQLEKIVNPMLNPIRKIIPSIGNFDFSPVILIIILQMIENLLLRMIKL